jgi:hypothetical protein
MTYLKPIITVLWGLITTHFFCFGWHFPAVCASAPCHYCVISYPTLKLSFQERISTLTEKIKDDLLRRMREKHPQFVFDVLIRSTQEQGWYHPDPWPTNEPSLIGITMTGLLNIHGGNIRVVPTHLFFFGRPSNCCPSENNYVHIGEKIEYTVYLFSQTNYAIAFPSRWKYNIYLSCIYLSSLAAAAK